MIIGTWEKGKYDHWIIGIFKAQHQTTILVSKLSKFNIKQCRLGSSAYLLNIQYHIDETTLIINEYNYDVIIDMNTLTDLITTLLC